MGFSQEFQVLRLEAGIAAAAIGQGVNGINNANYAHKGYYHFAFFNFSVALERLGKLIFIIDYLIENGKYPTDGDLRASGHKISVLMEIVTEIRSRRGLDTEEFPPDLVTAGIVDVLSDFATSTRYYNLDYLVGGKSAAMTEPIAGWSEKVGKRILQLHYKPRRRASDEANAELLGTLMDEISLVRHTAEDGTLITSWSAGALETAKIAVLQKYSRMYVLRVVRFLTDNLCAIQYKAMHRGHDIPHFGDFFSIYRNDDSYFLRRKSWDPYRL